MLQCREDLITGFMSRLTWTSIVATPDVLQWLANSCTHIRHDALTVQAIEALSLGAVIAIRGTLSAEDLITDFMCEPADMDDWMSTAATPHSGQGQGSHDPKGLVGSSQGTGFFSRHTSAQKRTAGTPPRGTLGAVKTEA